MNNETYEYNYAVRHKPTGKWLEFENDELELTVIVMTLVDFKNCTISKNKKWLDFALRSAVFNGEGVPNLEKKVFKGIPNYGHENFLEFEIVKLKTTYTIEE